MCVVVTRNIKVRAVMIQTVQSCSCAVGF